MNDPTGPGTTPSVTVAADWKALAPYVGNGWTIASRDGVWNADRQTARHGSHTIAAHSAEELAHKLSKAGS